MPITPAIEDKADALIKAIKQDAPGLHARLLALLASINVGRQQAGMKPFTAKGWIIESLVNGAIGPEQAVELQKLQGEMDDLRKQKEEEIDQQLREAL